MKRLIRKSNYTTLVIVDIQKNYALYFDEEYLNEVEAIIKQGWNNIIVVADDIDGSPEIPDFISNAANAFDFNNKRVLVLIPDNTRSGPMNIFFREI